MQINGVLVFVQRWIPRSLLSENFGGYKVKSHGDDKHDRRDDTIHHIHSIRGILNPATFEHRPQKSRANVSVNEQLDTKLHAEGPVAQLFLIVVSSA